MSDRLLFFPSPVDTQQQAEPVVLRVHTPVPVITEEVVIRSVAPAPTAHLAVGDDAWSWQELRSYVVRSIEATIGLFPRDELKEAAIFKAFCSRWPEDAPAIARYAFETMNGYWKGAPVGVTRFCKASDEYFGVPIVKALRENRPS